MKIINTIPCVYEASTYSLKIYILGGEGEEWGGGRMDREFGVSRCKFRNLYSKLHLERINKKALLYSTGNYIQSLGINRNGKEC